MARLSEPQVMEALERLDEEAGAGAPSLTAEQERAFAELTRLDPEDRVARIAEMAERLATEAQAGSGKVEALLREMGIEPGMASRFLGGDKLDGDAARAVQRAAEDYAASSRRDAEAVARRLAAEPAPRAARPPRMTV